MGEHATVYVGSGDWSGETGRIQVYGLELESARLEMRQELEAGGVAAFMARSRDGRCLYVADETKGLLSTYIIEPGSGRLSLHHQISAAGHPVHLTIDPSGTRLVTCFFEESKTQVFALSPDGRIGESLCLVDSGRESHCAVFDPSGRYLFVPARGDNWIAHFSFEQASGQLAPHGPERVPELAGAGPRHLAFHPNGRFAYLANELSLTLSVYAFDPARGELSALQRQVAAAPPGIAGGAAADIHVHPAGRYLYLSNRQGDQSTLAVFELDPETGRARLLGHESTRGRTPRNFALDASGRILIAGNQDSHGVAVFRIASEGAELRHIASQPVAPGPFFVGIY